MRQVAHKAPLKIRFVPAARRNRFARDATHAASERAQNGASKEREKLKKKQKKEKRTYEIKKKAMINNRRSGSVDAVTSSRAIILIYI